MSKMAARMLIEDMEHIGPIALKDVKETQKKVALAIQHLEDQGEIIVP
jgi:flagellar motor switch protein FliG